jgi:hypothetical protein
MLFEEIITVYCDLWNIKTLSGRNAKPLYVEAGGMYSNH